MADEQARDSRFDYKTNSNLVLRCDNTLIDKRDRNEATGEVHSLVGKIDTMRMGDRVTRGKVALPIGSNTEAANWRKSQDSKGYYKNQEDLEGGQRKPRQAYAGSYQPKSQETRSAYGELNIRSKTQSWLSSNSARQISASIRSAFF